MKKDNGAGVLQRVATGSLRKSITKRRRVISDDSESGEELQEACKRKACESSYAKQDSGAEGNNNTVSDAKRSRLDTFDFEEYDEFDKTTARNGYEDGIEGAGSSRVVRKGSSGKMMLEKSTDLRFDSSTNASGSRNKGFNIAAKNRILRGKDDADLPISVLKLKHQKTPNDSIRLQGKNGVLKVMVNKKLDLSRKKHDCHASKSRKCSTSENVSNKKPEVQPTIYLGSEISEKQPLSLQRDKNKMKSREVLMRRNTPASDSETDGTDKSPKGAPIAIPAGNSQQEHQQPTGNSLKVVEKEKNKFSTAKTISPTIKEGNTKRGTSTEKQQLREKIRKILMDAGWTIDYRPRRNRDYLDAVYISPCGTAYWSIVKAYDAFLKQLEEDGNRNKSAHTPAPFSPLLEDINKLTRQTRKKTEREMKKRRDDGASNGYKKTSRKEYAQGTKSDKHDEFDTHKNISISEDRRLMNMTSIEVPACSLIRGRKSKIAGRCTLLVRSSEKGQNLETDEYVHYPGKRTLLAWMIDSGTVKLSEKVQYMNRRKTRILLEGWITRDGIHCRCCSKILTVSKFELHAGSKSRQPFQNIVLECGASLLQCLIDAWNRQDESERKGFYSIKIDGDDPNDDTCGICADGGDLICCDGCPSTFHQSCLGIMMLPPGDWHCPYCVCKFCGIAHESLMEDNMGTNELHLCILCEKKYHKLCGEDFKVENVLQVKNKIPFTSFCGQTCQELYDQLGKIAGVKHELEAGFSWSIIQRTDLDSNTSHCDFPQRVESNSKLAVALSIMDECFLPIVDRRSEINIIHNVVYNCGSNFSRLSFCGFYTAILERGDEIVCAASLRIHGTQLAEMPFIGTRHIYRRKGMCRQLLSAIEMFLFNLKVDKLIIPAISEHIHTWTEVFGFNQLEESHKEEMRSMNMLVFPGVDMLQKQLVKQGAPQGSRNDDCNKPCPSPALIGASDTVSSANSAKCDPNKCYDTGPQSADEINAKVESVCSVHPDSVVQSHDNTRIGAQNCSPTAINFSNNEAKPIKSEVENKFDKSSANVTHSTGGEIDTTLDVQDAPENGIKVAREKSIKPSLQVVQECDTAYPVTRERADENQGAVVSPNTCGIDESIPQHCSESFQSKVNEDQGVVFSISEASNPKALPTKGDILSTVERSDSGPYVIDGKENFADPMHGSSLDCSFQCNTEDAANEEALQSPKLSEPEPTIQFTSDLYQPSTNYGENEPNPSSEKTTDSKGN